MIREFSVVDLFAGVGGFSQGFMRANLKGGDFRFVPKLLVDSDPSASYTFKKNFPQIPYWTKDISKLDGVELLGLLKMQVEELDFLIGGPPCQGFSPNGKRWLDDSRNHLFAKFIDLGLHLRPKIVILENVPAALAAYETIANSQIQEIFQGYRVRCKTLNATAFGVPQIRKRAFIVAVRDDLGISDFDYPAGNFEPLEVGCESHNLQKSECAFISVRDAIGDLPSLSAGESIDGTGYPIPPASEYQAARRMRSLAIFNHVARSHSKEFQEKISPIRPGTGNAQLPKKKRFSDNYFSQAYARLHPEGVGFTITANFRNPGSGRFTHYQDNRSITVREAARLQSFDDTFIFHGFETDQQRHVGNAVPPLLAEALAEHFGGLLYSHS
jgi:DNA (cytosine-5)-methyltransferase 1